MAKARFERGGAVWRPLIAIILRVSSGESCIGNGKRSVKLDSAPKHFARGFVCDFCLRRNRCATTLIVSVRFEVAGVTHRDAAQFLALTWPGADRVSSAPVSSCSVKKSA
jgi:hypothetical protein